MHRFVRLVSFGLVLGYALQAVYAQSVEERMQRKEEDGYLQEAIKDVNERCKAKIVGVGDWASFKGALKDQSSHVSTNCGQAIEGLGMLCNGADDDTKRVIAKALKTIQCRGLADEMQLDLKGSTWTITTNVHEKRTGVRNFAQQFLAKSLK